MQSTTRSFSNVNAIDKLKGHLFGRKDKFYRPKIPSTRTAQSEQLQIGRQRQRKRLGDVRKSLISTEILTHASVDEHSWRPRTLALHVHFLRLVSSWRSWGNVQEVVKRRLAWLDSITRTLFLRMARSLLSEAFSDFSVQIWADRSAFRLLPFLMGLCFGTS